MSVSVEAPARTATARPQRGGSEGAWAYLLPLRPGAAVLYHGPDQGPLSGWPNVVERLTPPMPGPAATDASGRFAAVVIEDLPAALALLPAPLRQLPALFGRCRQQLVSDGRVILTFPVRTVRSLVHGDRAISLRQVTSALKTAGFDGIRVLRMRDALARPDLHTLEAAPLTAADLLVRRPAVCVVAENGSGGADTVARSILARLQQTTSEETGLSVHLGSGAVHRLHSRDAVVRIPQRPEAVPRCANNYATLERLARTRLRVPAPAPLGTTSLNGLAVFCESRLPGRGVEYLRLGADERRRRAIAATAALMQLQSATRSLPCPVDLQFETLFAAPAARLLPYLDAEAAGLLQRTLAAVRGELGTTILPAVTVHGDFKIANLLWTDDAQVAGVVDWDLSSARGLPVIDYLTYTAFDRSLDGGAPICSGMAELVVARPEDRVYAGFCLQTLGIGAELYSACAVMALVHYGTHHYGILEAQERLAWCDRHVSPHLAAACRRLLTVLDRRA